MINRRSFIKTLSALPVMPYLLTLAGCGPGKPNIPGNGGLNTQAISSGVITSLTAVQASLQALVNAGKTQFKAELDAINKVLDSAKVINTDIQNGAFSGSTEQKIIALAALASQLASQFGANSNLILAINIGVGLFNSIRGAFSPAPVGVARALVDYKGQQDELDVKVRAYQAELKSRSR